jgi:16S rRNA (guanine(966)-N(2))-methyltransferase RsmD
MRIISGKYKGKKLDGYLIDGTRPTMDRVKESLFGMIQGFINDSVCLDLFAGSGNLGLEALSNGAQKCYFVDHNKEVIKILNKNLKDIKGSIIIHADYKNALNEIKEQMDIIFLDPPYHDLIINDAINLILEKNLLKDGGILICEVEEEKIICNLNLIKEKKYGPKTVKIYQK